MSKHTLLYCTLQHTLFMSLRYGTQHLQLLYIRVAAHAQLVS